MKNIPLDTLLECTPDDKDKPNYNTACKIFSALRRRLGVTNVQELLQNVHTQAHFKRYKTQIGKKSAKLLNDCLTKHGFPIIPELERYSLPVRFVKDLTVHGPSEEAIIHHLYTHGFKIVDEVYQCLNTADKWDNKLNYPAITFDDFNEILKYNGLPKLGTVQKRDSPTKGMKHLQNSHK